MANNNAIGNKLPLPMTSVEELGRTLQAVRKEQGLTQLDVAGLAGLGNRFVIDLERGKETIQMQKVLEVIALLGLELHLRRKGEP